MHQNSAILAKNWVRIETPTQAPHLPDLSWRIAITRPQKKCKELGNLRLVFKLQLIQESLFLTFFIKNKLIRKPWA